MIEDLDKIKIFGLYPGAITEPHKVRTLSEAELYHFINSLSLKIQQMEDEAKKEGKEVDVSEERYALAFAINQTRKFGVTLPWPSLGEEMTTTPTFNVWYGFYHNHFNYNMSKAALKSYQRTLLRGGNTQKYLPKGNWKDMLENPIAKQLERK